MLQPRSPCSDVGGARLTLCQAVYVPHSHCSAHLSRQGACPDGVYVSPDNQDTLRTHAIRSHRLERRRVRTIWRVRFRRVSVQHSIYYGWKHSGDTVRVFAPDPLAPTRRGTSLLPSRSRAMGASICSRSLRSPMSTGGKRRQINQNSLRLSRSISQPVSTTRSSNGSPRRGSGMSACIRTLPHPDPDPASLPPKKRSLAASHNNRQACPTPTRASTMRTQAATSPATWTLRYCPITNKRKNSHHPVHFLSHPCPISSSRAYATTSSHSRQPTARTGAERRLGKRGNMLVCRRVVSALSAMASTAPPRRPKRKRVRKTRTAVISSSESSSSDEQVPVKSPDAPKRTSPTTQRAPSGPKGGYDSDSGSELGHDDLDTAQHRRDLNDLADALSPPLIHVPTGDDEAPVDTYTPKIRVGNRMATLTPQAISDELHEKQKESFHSLWMQSLTEEFGNELDELRQNDPRLSSGPANATNATARLPLLIDALSFGSEVYSHAPTTKDETGHDMVDEIQMALPD